VTLIADLNGRVTARIPAPPAERKLEFVCASMVAEDDVALLLQYAESAPQRGLVLFHHGADGRLKRQSDLNSNPFHIERCLPTSDGGLLPGGSHGLPPHFSWWFEKLTLEGGRVFEARGTGHQGRVAALSPRPGGHLQALIEEKSAGGTDKFEWHLHHYVDGMSRSSTRVEADGGYAAALRSDGGVITSDDRTISIFEDSGKLKHKTPWRFHRTGPIVVADDGFWAAVSEGDHLPDIVVRLDATGAVLWRSQHMNIRGLARTPDNQIVVLVMTDNDTRARLLRFDHR